MAMVSAEGVARSVGVDPATIRRWANRGVIPSAIRPGCEVARWYDLKAAEAVVRAMRAPRTTKRCSVCARDLSLDQFRQRKHRSGKVGPADKCHDCHKAYNRSLRERDAAAKGKACRRRQDLAAEKSRRETRRLERWRRQLEAQEVTRQHLRTARRIKCATCGEERSRADFYGSFLATLRPSEMVCRSCAAKEDRAKFQAAKNALTDAYVKRQLTKYSTLRAADIPPALIEAKRAQLAVQRLVEKEST